MRGWFTRTVAVIAMCALWPGQGHAEPSVNEMLRNYDNPKSETQRSMIASNLISIEVGLGWANTALRAQRMQPGLYCPPDKPATGAQLVDVLRRALKDEPRLGDRPAGFALLAALQRTFPCK